MSINFFQGQCKSTSKKPLFGVCDDISGSPAYINETDNSKWIAIVHNPDLKEIEFYAIDNCVKILRPSGELESRCDGVLMHQNNLIFIELKERVSSGWFGKGSQQLRVTINIFLANYNTSDFETIEAYVCNNLKPKSNPARASTIQKFYDDTGFILRDEQNVSV